MAQTMAVSDTRKKETSGCQIEGNTRICWHLCASARWFAACFRCDCITTWGHKSLLMSHRAHHLAGQPWCGWHLSEAVGHTEGRAALAHSGAPSCLYVKTEGLGGFWTQHRQATFIVQFSMIRKLTKVEMRKVGKLATLRTGPLGTNYYVQ